MDVNSPVVQDQLEDIKARLKGVAYGDYDDLGVAVKEIVFVGSIADELTSQVITLFRISMAVAGQDGPYDYLTATYIHDFWGDASHRGEIADVVVFNGVDGFIAKDPADEWACGKAEEPRP